MEFAPYFKIESFGAVDGPGIRLVVFLQGCILRCKYCHNPESWKLDAQVNKISTDEIINLFNKNKEYYKDGGITLSGGEPLLHLDFIIELSQKCKLNGIHLALDTSGANFNSETIKKYDVIIKNTNLWIVDIKSIDPNKHKLITGIEHQNELDLIKYLERNNANYWIRYVFVPKLTDKREDLISLGIFLKSLKNMSKFELLPYHKLAINKYKNLKIKYPLLTTQDPTKKSISLAINLIRKYLKN